MTDSVAESVSKVSDLSYKHESFTKNDSDENFKPLLEISLEMGNIIGSFFCKVLRLYRKYQWWSLWILVVSYDRVCF